ncbi:hypothetical protein [uncultured Corynebacterium sp.]|uniref:hypothetical protein n=1 Tax=uncultured Corynebacterium sp. TaxID=159447 RepID=UPI002592DFC3|nr:hypothetical protein [uncultured Corynebacterium sp.]
MALFRSEYGQRLEKIVCELGGTAEPTGGGHIKVSFQNGTEVYCASTPSDRRAFLNARRELEEKSGRKIQRSKTGKYTHRKTPQFASAPRTESSDQAKKCQGLEKTLEDIDITLQDALTNPRKYTQTQIEKILADREGIAHYLHTHGRDVDLYFKEKIDRPSKESA